MIALLIAILVAGVALLLASSVMVIQILGALMVIAVMAATAVRLWYN